MKNITIPAADRNAINTTLKAAEVSRVAALAAKDLSVRAFSNIEYWVAERAAAAKAAAKATALAASFAGQPWSPESGNANWAEGEARVAAQEAYQVVAGARNHALECSDAARQAEDAAHAAVRAVFAACDAAVAAALAANVDAGTDAVTDAVRALLAELEAEALEAEALAA